MSRCSRIDPQKLSPTRLPTTTPELNPSSSTYTSRPFFPRHLQLTLRQLVIIPSCLYWRTSLKFVYHPVNTPRTCFQWAVYPFWYMYSNSQVSHYVQQTLPCLRLLLLLQETGNWWNCCTFQEHFRVSPWIPLPVPVAVHGTTTKLGRRWVYLTCSVVLFNNLQHNRIVLISTIIILQSRNITTALEWNLNPNFIKPKLRFRRKLFQNIL